MSVERDQDRMAWVVSRAWRRQALAPALPFGGNFHDPDAEATIEQLAATFELLPRDVVEAASCR